MTTKNPFDLLDDDTEDPSLLLAAVEKQKLENPKKAPALAPAQPAKSAKLPTKPPPPAQAVREAKNEFGRGARRGTGLGGRGRGGAGGYNYDSRVGENSNGFSGGYRPSEEGEGGRQFERRSGNDGPRGSFRGGRRGGFNNGEPGERERPRRQFDRRSGTGRGNEYKRDGAGRGNWGGATDEIALETEENVPENEKKITEKHSGEEAAADANKENAGNEAEEKEPETKEMTLEEYEKILEEKRKALLALKTDEGRKVDVKDFESMQQLSNKKSNNEIFIKLGSEKDKRKDADKEEKVKKSVSINEFLKPAEGERYVGPGRGRGRGRGSRGGYSGGNTGSNVSAPTPKIEDPGHFPSLGGK